MKQQQIVNAYKVIKKYENETLPLDVSYGLFKLKKLLQPQWDFEVEREEAIFKKYNPQNDEMGNIIFNNHEDQVHFEESIRELLNMDVEWNNEKVSIPFNHSFNVSMSDIEALDDFVTF